MSGARRESGTWFTIDIEKLEDSNFNLIETTSIEVDYPALIESWIDFCSKNSIISTCFILGSFAKEYPEIVKKLDSLGHEIACHGLNHELVYNLDFSLWKEQTKEAKEILEGLIGKEVKGYRSPSWSLPFEDRYYESLAELGFAYSSSYFPFKTSMYGHTEDKKNPFMIETKYGAIEEIPLPKNFIPFSGGFYLRALPVFIQKFLKASLEKQGVRPATYIHPYELLDKNLIGHFSKRYKINLDFLLAFFASSNVKEKLQIYK